MAEKIVSPGVFTNEKDLTFLPAAVAQIGGAFIGPTTKGPAFVPTALDSFTDFERIFGKTNTNFYMPYAVKEYVKNGGRATVVRIMNNEGYQLNQGLVNVFASGSNVATYVSNSLAASGLYTAAEVEQYKSSPQLLFTLHPTKLYSNLSNGADYFNQGLLDTDPLFNGTNTLTTLTTNYSSSFTLVLEDNESDTYTYTVDGLVNTDKNFFTKVFGTTPSTLNDPVYLYNSFKNTATNVYSASAGVNKIFAVIPQKPDDANVSMTFETVNAEGNSHTYASTPWIISQTVNGTNNKLFRFHTLSEGTNANYEVKVGISNIRSAGNVPGSEYGDFTVVVRYVDQSLIPGSPFTTIDSDLRPNVIETFNLCNLDPSSKNYIGRKIGDRFRYFDSTTKRSVVAGDYENKSKYVRIEVDARISKGTYSPALVPFGFEALYTTLPGFNVSGSVSDINGNTQLLNAGGFPIVSYKSLQVDSNSVYNKKVYFGFDYDFSGNDNLNYLKPLPDNAIKGINKNFLLSNCTQDISATDNGYTGSVDLTDNTSIDTRKFMVPFQGGFDGTYPNKVIATGIGISSVNVQGFDVSDVTADGYIAYKNGIDCVGSPTSVDINMLVCPGLVYGQEGAIHGKIVSYAEQVAQDRGDTFFIFDAAAINATVLEAAEGVADWDSNYAATYFPWVKILDVETNRPIWVPPTCVIPGVLAFNDKVGEQWFAPAGLNRGVLTNVMDAYVRLSRTDIDTLYDARVNPIATLPAQGVTVWGQKTLQAKPSALDRINVRRLLIALKKFIASATQYLVFEQNTSATRNRFLNIVNPYMESVQQRQGLYAFKVVMDDTNNTPDLIDRNIMYGQIYLQPARTAEFIIIDFNILPTGATFGA